MFLETSSQKDTTYLSSSSGLDLERPVLHVTLDFSGIELTSNKTLSIEYSVSSIHSNLILGGIADQALSIVKCDV